MLRIHLDEHVSHAIAEGLRRRGIDVTTTTDAGLISADDEDHVAFAMAQRRVIFTHDEDYVTLHSRGVEHAGIAWCPPNKRSIAFIIDMLELIAHVMTEAEMRNRLDYL